MAFKLDVFFHGLCAFVPQGKRMYAFLPRADSLAGEPLSLSPHLAVVQYFQNDLAEVNGTPDNADGVWRLVGVHLTLRPGGKLQSLDNLSRSNGKAGSGAAFNEIVSIEQACAKRGIRDPGVLDPALLKSTLGGRAKDIAARLVLQKGRISTDRLSGTEGRAIEWTFRPFFARFEKRDHCQVAAARVRLEMDVDADFIDLHATYLKDGFAAGILRFRPQRAGDGVAINVYNEEAEQILHTRDLPSVTLGRPRPEDTVFEAYSLLLKRPVPRGQMPIPIAAGLAGAAKGPIAGGSPPCSPVRLRVQ